VPGRRGRLRGLEPRAACAGAFLTLPQRTPPGIACFFSTASCGSCRMDLVEGPHLAVSLTRASSAGEARGFPLHSSLLGSHVFHA